MVKTVVVFGASGFIGTHLLHQLSIQGGYRLIGVDIVAPKHRLDSVSYVMADVRDLSAFTVDGDVDLLVNLAAVHKTPGHPDSAYYETNILGAVEGCRFARRKNVRDVIFTSSISVYGPGEETKTEESPLLPVRPMVVKNDGREDPSFLA